MSAPFTTMAALLGVKTPRDHTTAHALQGLFCFLMGNDAMVSKPQQVSIAVFYLSNVPQLAVI